MANSLLWSGVVTESWIDELDHVNFLEYQRVADRASSAFWKNVKGDRKNKLEFVITETYVNYRRELRLGMPVEIKTQLVEFDDKRFHLLHSIQSGGESVCNVETLNLCFDPEIRKVAKFTSTMLATLEAVLHREREPARKLAIVRKSS